MTKNCWLVVASYFCSAAPEWSVTEGGVYFAFDLLVVSRQAYLRRQMEEHERKKREEKERELEQEILDEQRARQKQPLPEQRLARQHQVERLQQQASVPKGHTDTQPQQMVSEKQPQPSTSVIEDREVGPTAHFLALWLPHWGAVYCHLRVICLWCMWIVTKQLGAPNLWLLICNWKLFLAAPQFLWPSIKGQPSPKFNLLQIQSTLP